MKFDFWGRRVRAGLIASLLAFPVAAPAQPPVQKLLLGIGDKVVSPLMINRVVPEYLGYYRQEGVSLEVIPVGTYSAVVAGMAKGRFQFGPGQASLQLPFLARGETFPAIDYLEIAYPGKFGIAVAPASGITSLSQLKGRKIGINNFSGGGYQIGQEMLRLSGVDPQKDVSWISIGEGVTPGLALAKGDISALDYYDIGFGQIEAAGIKLNYLPDPPNFPKLGGAYIMATPDILKNHRDWAVGVGRATLKGEVFIMANPEAAAWIYLQMYPEAAPKNMSIQDQVKAVMVPLVARMKLFAPNDPATKWGYMKPSDWQDEMRLSETDLGKKTLDPTVLYTNALVDECNDFDRQAIEAQARNFKLPYK
jgi:NitT/TauT family transport system substrate-binding protein